MLLARRRRTGSETTEPLIAEGDAPTVITSERNNWSQRNHVVNSAYPNNVTDDYYLDDEYNNTGTYIEPEPVMTARDRTHEFVNTIQTLQGQNIVRAVQARDPKKSKVIQSHSEFMLIAKNIGRNIASTYAKLEKLTLLAKRKSLFDDRSTEIHELTYMIKSDLSSLNQQIAQLQDVSKKQRHNASGKHLKSHAVSVVLTLQSKLASMSTSFKQVLEVRTENLKHQKSRRDQFSQGGLPPPPPPSSTSSSSSTVVVARSNNNSLLQQQQQQDQVSIDLESSPLLMPSQQQQRTQIQASLIYDETDHYLHERAETMQNIESTIVELGGIFQQLAHMVKEQEEMVDRIDTNVEDAELNIDAAHTEIVKYFQSVTSNRWLMIKIFGVLIFFFIFFVVFLA